MAETDPEELADRLEAEADELEQRSAKLEEQTDDVAKEWESKRSDPSVPGANPPEGQEGDAPPTGAPSGKD
jgi:hypothetical protein